MTHDEGDDNYDHDDDEDDDGKTSTNSAKLDLLEEELQWWRICPDSILSLLPFPLFFPPFLLLFPSFSPPPKLLFYIL